MFYYSTSETTSDPSIFNQEWERFLATKEINYCQIGKESYLDYEFNLIEEFSEQQSLRYRPYIKSVDRYEGCRPYHDNRITLADGTEMSASLAQFTEDHHFIAAQAPFKSNRHLFWQMILEKQINQIVMVTEFSESKNPKKELAYPYFPLETNEKVLLENGLEISTIEKSILMSELEEFIEIRKINIQGDGINKIVTHYWYRNWLDDTAPNKTDTIFALIKRVEADKGLLNSNSPILVHCSAGVGRTGVFIALYYLMQIKKSKDQKIDLFHFLGYLRWQRPYLVAVLPQYKFCYQIHALLEKRVDLPYSEELYPIPS
ncbi:MAG: dual specificity protein phosphatase family protein [Candidatus Protochlamydia sp.]|nr:dual specificity protein phosphatase family protein [Candidatus Protochlamydia sp.]